MKNMLKIGVALGVLMVAGAAMQPAHAICGAAYFFGSTNVDGETSYVLAPGWCDINPTYGYPYNCSSDIQSSVTSGLAASFWQVSYGDPTAGLGNDNGTLTPFYVDPIDNAWMYVNPTYASFITGTWAQSTNIDGCIDTPPPGQPDLRCMAVMLSDVGSNGEAAFALLTTPDSGGEYDFIQQGGAAFIELVPLPKPRIINSANTGDISVGVEMASPALEDIAGGLYLSTEGDCAPAAAGGVADMVVGYRAYSQNVPVGSGAPTSQDKADWVDEGLFDAGATAAFSVDCPEATETTEGKVEVYVSYSLVFDSGFELDFVAGGVSGQDGNNSTRAECGPNLADPERIRVREDQGTRQRPTNRRR